jgi:ABC-type phosphate transport system substrate-binding protein
MRFTSLLLFLFFFLTAVRSEIRVVGSDLLGNDFIDGLTAYSKRNDFGLKLTMEGSRTGLERLKSGEAELAVAYHTAVVVVPASLPLTQITVAQLNAIYGDDSQSGIKRWTDLGVTGEWAQRNILPIIPGPGGGLTYDLFRYTVLTAPALKPTVSVQPGLGETLTRIRGDEGGMAIMPLLPANQPRLKALLVARGSQDVAFGPTQNNIHSGDYPIRLPVYLVFRKDAARRIQSALRYLLSEDAVPLWEKAQLVPLPIQVRNQQIFDLEVL